MYLCEYLSKQVPRYIEREERKAVLFITWHVEWESALESQGVCVLKKEVISMSRESAKVFARVCHQRTGKFDCMRCAVYLPAARKYWSTFKIRHSALHDVYTSR